MALKILTNLEGVLLRFREGKYSTVSDTEQMFHQINVILEGQDPLIFPWQDDKTKRFKITQCAYKYSEKLIPRG